MKNILYLIFVGVVVWVAYATFFGNAEERAMRDRLFEGVKTTGQAVSEIVQSQKGKFSAGEYDKAIDQVSNVLQSLKKQSKDSGVENAQIADLEKKKIELEKMLAAYNAAEASKASGSQARTTSEAAPAPTPAEMNAKLQDISNVLGTIEGDINH